MSRCTGVSVADVLLMQLAANQNSPNPVHIILFASCNIILKHACQSSGLSKPADCYLEGVSGMVKFLQCTLMMYAGVSASFDGDPKL